MKNHRLALILAATWLAILPLGRNTAMGGPPSMPPAAERLAPPPTSRILASDTGYLVVRDASGNRGGSFHYEPYQPQAGDVLLYTQSKYNWLFRLAGSGPPTHAAIVFTRPDGTPASLEITGPRVLFAKVHHIDVGPQLHGYPGEIMVRQPRTPLTLEQSAALTQFALAQHGKEFARGRLMLQATPLRIRNGLRREAFGHTYLDRTRWICSEIVIAAASVAGLIDPNEFPANAMYPRDLAFDERYDLSGAYHPPVAWVPHPAP